jgi:hypothetical protein
VLCAAFFLNHSLMREHSNHALASSDRGIVRLVSESIATAACKLRVAVFRC